MKQTELTTDQIGSLLKIVKPTKVQLGSTDSNRFEALFQAKTLVHYTFVFLCFHF